MMMIIMMFSRLSLLLLCLLHEPALSRCCEEVACKLRIPAFLSGTVSLVVVSIIRLTKYILCDES